MKTVIVLVLLCCCINTLNCFILSNDSEFVDWEIYKTQYGKSYESESLEVAKFKVWRMNKEMVVGHNRRYYDGEVPYRMALNQFSDLDDAEFNKLYAGLVEEEVPDEERVDVDVNGPVEDAIDWVERGAVTDVKNQGHCGSCYSFSVTGAIEGQHFLATKQLVSFSEQQIVDCSHNHGCHGGDRVRTFQYVKKQGGVDTEDSYPYEATERKCRFKKRNVGATVGSYIVLRKSEDALLNAVSSKGPVSVSIHVLNSFRHYKSGVYSDASCPSRDMHHAVLVVG